ncbi:glycogen synthase [candidate division KSB1 bacterium]
MKKYKVLFLSSEVSPFLNVTALSDYSYRLSLALKDLGHEVRVIMPKYKEINDRKYILREVIRLKDIGIPVGNEEKKISIKSAFIPNSKVQIYFIDFKPYFFRDGLYSDAKSKKLYTDNDDRFILFSRGTLETLKLLYWQPDIIHCNDWQTALIPLYLKTLYRDDKFFNKSSSILSIHNYGEIGSYNKKTEIKTSFLDNNNYKSLFTEYKEKFSFLKAGISGADYIAVNSNTLVSKGVRKGIEDISNLLKKHQERIFEVSSGVNYSIWDPENDELIPACYGFKTLSQKTENKKALLKKLRFPYNPESMVVGLMYNKMDEEIDNVLSNIAKDIKKLNIQVIIIGKIDRKTHSKLKKYKELYPQNISYCKIDDDKTLHLVLAGCDSLLYPLLFCPDRINPLVCLKYGTIPIVRSYSEYSDSIQEFDIKENSGVGFVIKSYTSRDIISKLRKVANAYKNENLWLMLQKNGMKKEFLWKDTAKKYSKIYSQAMKKR